MVKLIAGADQSDDGEVKILGDAAPSLHLLPQIGYMAQSDALYMEISARDNMLFFGSLYGLSPNQLNERIDWAAELVKLAQDLDRPVQNFSGGMKRRLSLAIALLHEPKVLLLDEPTVGIDPILRHQIWEELNRYANLGTAILLTTHVMDEAEKAHRVCMMREGQVIADGTPKALMSKTKSLSLERAFLHYGGAA